MAGRGLISPPPGTQAPEHRRTRSVGLVLQLETSASSSANAPPPPNSFAAPRAALTSDSMARTLPRQLLLATRSSDTTEGKQSSGGDATRSSRKTRPPLGGSPQATAAPPRSGARGVCVWLGWMRDRAGETSLCLRSMRQAPLGAPSLAVVGSGRPGAYALGRGKEERLLAFPSSLCFVNGVSTVLLLQGSVF